MKRRTFTSEAELVGRAAEWLRADGWDCFYEVAPWGSGAARADIVATRGPLLAVVECKMALSLALLEQCEAWRPYANVTWAAVPYGNRSRFATRVASDWLGVGVMSLQAETWARDVLVAPALRRRVDEKLRNALDPSQQRTAPGAAGGFRTPFRATCERLLESVRVAGGRLPVKQAMTELQHHYSSAACARASLIERTERGVVPGLRLAREGRAVFFEVSP
jgi:hypothetical protein